MPPLGPVALIGSGETSAAGGRIFEAIARRYQSPLRIAVLETPAGFELNSDRVAGRVAEYLEQRLVNHSPEIHVIPARKRGTSLGPDNPELLAPLTGADLIYMGAGSPTYAVRQLRDSLAWHAILARHWQGAAVILASAAAISAGFVALPVYEIYKAGHDLHWYGGLDLFGPFGLKLAIVSHWNNSEGGDELDTSHCFMGRPRWQVLAGMLPQLTTVLAIDEHTGLIIDLENGRADILGRGAVTVIRDGLQQRFVLRQSFPLTTLGSFHPTAEKLALPPEIPMQPLATEEAEAGPSAEVLSLVAQREAARQAQDWSEADDLREKIQELGWNLQDTADGPRLVRA